VQAASSEHGASQKALTAVPGHDGSAGRESTGTHTAAELSDSQVVAAPQVLVHAPQRQLSPSPHAASPSQRLKKFVSLPGSVGGSRVAPQLMAETALPSSNATHRVATERLFDFAAFILAFTNDALADVGDDARIVGW
jgi:hypothetical protein